MILLKYCVFFLFIIPFKLSSQGSQTNVLLDNSKNRVQVTTEINEYASQVANIPIKGTIMITHATHASIDNHSFRIGTKPLKVEFVQSMPMSSYSDWEVAIYSFSLEGMQKGTHTLPPIEVKVGDQYYQAASLTLQVAPRSN